MSETQSTPTSAPEASAAAAEASVDAANAEALEDGADETDEVEGEEGLAQELLAKAAEAEKKPVSTKKKLKLKVNGKDLEEELDFNDDARLTRALQKEKAFDSASEELSSLKKQFSGLVEALKGDQVIDILKELGHDVDGLAEKHIQRLVDDAKKSPEQIEREKMEVELKTLKAEKEKAVKEKEERELENIRNQMATEIETDITAALDKTETILPKRNPKIIRSIAANMLFAMQNGYGDVKAQDVIPLVEAEYKRDLKELFDVLPEDTIESLVGKDNLGRIRKKRINTKKAQTVTANQIVKETGEKSNREETGKKKIGYKNFFSMRDDE